MRYSKIDDEYALLDDLGQFIFSTPEVAVAFSRAGTLLKHGPTVAVEGWLRDARRKYRAAAMQTEADDLVVIISDKWNLDELNKCLSISGYVGRLYEQLQPYLAVYERSQQRLTDYEKAESLYRLAEGK